MSRGARLSIALLVVGIAGVAAPARADVIQVSSGSLAGDAFGAFLSIQSVDRGLALSAAGDRAGGIYALSDCNFSRCQPGDALSLAAGWNGSDFVGTATIDGRTFPLGMATATEGDASAQFAGTWTAPAFTGTGAMTATIAAPFTFSGGLTYPDSFMRPRESFAGSGIATIQLAWNPVLDSWGYTGSTYTFTSPPAATPEPATLFLVAPFALGLAWRLRSRVRQRVG
jgi:hypothetical protein